MLTVSRHLKDRVEFSNEVFAICGGCDDACCVLTGQREEGETSSSAVESKAKTVAVKDAG